MEKNDNDDDASYNESLVKKLDLEYSKTNEFDFSYSNKDKNLNKKKKKPKFSLFKKQDTTTSTYFNKTPLTKELTINRHVYNFSHNQASHYTSSLHRHNHHHSKTRLDGLDKLKKSISFTKSHEDTATASSYSNSCGVGGGGGGSSGGESKEEQLEPLVLNNYSSLVNSSNGLLTTAVSLKNKNKITKKHSSLSSSSQSQSPSPLSPSSPSSSLNSLNESPSNKMISFFNSKNNNDNSKINVNSGTNSFKRCGSSGVQKPKGFFNSNGVAVVRAGSAMAVTPTHTSAAATNGTTIANNSITTLNMNNSTNTTVTTTASSSSSSSSTSSSI